MRKKIHHITFISILLLIISYIAYVEIDRSIPTDERNRKELAVLKRLAKNRHHYRDSLQNYLDSMMLELHKNPFYNDQQRYNMNKQMLWKSQMYHYDNADHFSRRLMGLAENMGDTNLIAEARILSTFYLSQACLFIEANDIFNSIDIESPQYTKETKTQYYLYAGISYQRMAVYVNDSTNRLKYNSIGKEMFQKCIALSQDEGIKAFAQGRILERDNHMDTALGYYEKAVATIPESEITLSSLALSSLAKAYRHTGRKDDALYYYIKASKLNIINAMNSSIAVFDLAEHLYYNYNNEREASRYMQIAIENGEYFGMRSSINHIDRIVPELAHSEASKEMKVIIATILLFVLVLIYLTSLIIIHERNKKRISEYEKETKTQKVEKHNLDAENERLNVLYNQLKENNKVKDIYIGRLLEQNSDLSTTFTDFAIKSEQKLRKKQYDKLLDLIKDANKNNNRKEQYAWLDDLILSLFPNFIEEFNSLVTVEARSTGEHPQLTPSMRIFALIRLGIKDNHQLAGILKYSYNTVLNYRVRTRALAINPETFEAAMSQSVKD